MSTSPGNSAILERLRSFPESARSEVQEGFRLLQGIERGRWPSLFSSAALWLDNVYAVRLPELAPKIGVTPTESGSLLTMAGLVSGLLPVSNSVDELLDACISEGYLSPEVRPLARDFVTSLQTADVHGAIARSQLASQTLPSFESLDFSVDVRFLFRDGDIVVATPVLLVSLKTDIPTESLNFQASRGDVIALMNLLRDAMRFLDSADEIVKRKKAES